MTKRKNPERRLSFAVRPEHCVAVAAQLGHAGAHWTAETKILSLYLDTPDAAIGTLGFGFGIRRRGDTTLNNSRAALRRFARNAPMQNGWTTFRHALSGATPTDARKIQNALRSSDLRRRLAVVFQSEARRSFWSWPVEGENVDITLEQARIVNGGDTELALMTLIYSLGAAARVHALLDAIGEKVSLRMMSETLALAAYRRAGHREMGLSLAISPRLTAAMTTGEAFQIIAGAALHQFLLAKTRLQILHDSESVHQSRVALRRLSTAMRLFSPLVAGDELRHLKEELRRSKDALRAARDLDVRLHDLDDFAHHHPSPPPESARNLLTKQKNKAYAAVISTLDSPQEEILLRRIAAWIDSGDWSQDVRRADRREEPFSAFVQRTFGKLANKIYRRCRKLEEASAEDRHRTRIRVKNLRYGVEFLDSLVSRGKNNRARKRFHSFVAALKHLQTFLGEENDARAAHDYFAALPANKGGGDTGTHSMRVGTAIADHFRPRDPKAFHKIAAKLRRQLSNAKPGWGALVKN